MQTKTVVKKTKMMLREEARLGEVLERIIPETYQKFGSLEAAGKALGIRPNTLYVWMLRLGYTRKTVLVATREKRG
jgi:hypothetical protein